MDRFVEAEVSSYSSISTLQYNLADLRLTDIAMAMVGNTAVTVPLIHRSRVDGGRRFHVTYQDTPHIKTVIAALYTDPACMKYSWIAHCVYGAVYFTPGYK